MLTLSTEIGGEERQLLVSRRKKIPFSSPDSLLLKEFQCIKDVLLIMVNSLFSVWYDISRPLLHCSNLQAINKNELEKTRILKITKISSKTR